MPGSTGGGAKYTFVVCRGNYSGVVRAALARRPWWRDAVLEKCPSVESAGAKVSVSQRRLINERQDYVTTQELEAQEFDLLWKPVARVRQHAAALPPQSLDDKTSPSSPAARRTKTALQDRIGTVHTIPLSAHRDYTKRPMMVNHLPNGETLTTKPGLCRSMKHYYARAKINPFHAVPTTFLVNSSHNDDAGWREFSARFKEIARGDYSREDMPSKHCARNMWIVKPPNANQGQGIRVFSELSHIKRFVNGDKRGGRKLGNEWVVQKYLESPLLLWGRKFDIRVWVLVTNDFEILMYRQGYLRTSSSMFTTETQYGDRGGEKSAFVHLTNFCM